MKKGFYIQVLRTELDASSIMIVHRLLHDQESFGHRVQLGLRRSRRCHRHAFLQNAENKEEMFGSSRVNAREKEQGRVQRPAVLKQRREGHRLLMHAVPFPKCLSLGLLS